MRLAGGPCAPPVAAPRTASPPALSSSRHLNTGRARQQRAAGARRARGGRMDAHLLVRAAEAGEKGQLKARPVCAVPCACPWTHGAPPCACAGGVGGVGGGEAREGGGRPQAKKRESGPTCPTLPSFVFAPLPPSPPPPPGSFSTHAGGGSWRVRARERKQTPPRPSPLGRECRAPAPAARPRPGCGTWPKRWRTTQRCARGEERGGESGRDGGGTTTT